MSDIRQQAEQALAAHTHRRHAVLTGNGTTALWAALSALELPAGAAVLYPDLTCETAVNAAILAGLRPVFADVQSATAHPAAADLVLTAARSGARAMVPTHLFGHRAHLAPPARMCPAVVDAAQTAGEPEDLTGGVAAVLSFGPGKQLDLGHGGAIVTDDPGLAHACRRLVDDLAHAPAQREACRRAYMVDLVALSREHAPGTPDHAHRRLALLQHHGRGYLAPPAADLAARLPGALPRHAAEVRRRQVLAALLEEGLTELSGVRLLLRRGEAPWRFTFAMSGRRDAVIRSLQAAGLRASRLFPPVHRLLARPDRDYPRAIALAGQLVNLDLAGLGDHPAAACRAAVAAITRVLTRESVA